MIDRKNKLIQQFKNNNFIPENILNEKIDLYKLIEELYNNNKVPKNLLLQLIATNYSFSIVNEDNIEEELIDVDNIDIDWCKKNSIMPLYLIEESNEKILIVNCYNPIPYLENKKNIEDFFKKTYQVKSIRNVISTKYLFEKTLDNIELIKSNKKNIEYQEDQSLVAANNFLKEVFINAISEDVHEIHFEFNLNKSYESFIKFKQFNDLFIYSSIDDFEKVNNICNVVKRISKTETNNFGIINLELVNLQTIHIKISRIKTYCGEKYVFRIIPKISNISYEALSYPKVYLNKLDKFLKYKNGIFFLIGDFGSGKKTFILNYLNQNSTLFNKNVYLIEKPYLFLNKFNYITNENAKECLNSLEIIKQQSPNFVVLDDYHDREVLSKAIELSRYCLVLITINIPNVTFLPNYLLKNGIDFDSDVKPYLRIIQEQAKYFHLCHYCKEQIFSKDSRKIIDKININDIIIDEKTRFYKPNGCSKCHNLGYNRELFFYKLHDISEFKNLSNETKPTNLESNYFDFKNEDSILLNEFQLGNISIKNLM